MAKDSWPDDSLQKAKSHLDGAAESDGHLCNALYYIGCAIHANRWQAASRQQEVWDLLCDIHGAAQQRIMGLLTLVHDMHQQDQRMTQLEAERDEARQRARSLLTDAKKLWIDGATNLTNEEYRAMGDRICGWPEDSHPNWLRDTPAPERRRDDDMEL